MAAALLAGLQGGVAIMMSTGDSTHLKAALDTGVEHLRGSGRCPVPDHWSAARTGHRDFHTCE
jgi:hypothetical protein